MYRNPRGRKSPKVDALIALLARMATRHKVEPSEFFNYIVEAWKSERSKCEQLKITCREKREDSAVFLFTAGSGIIGQFPIPTQLLEGKNPLKDYILVRPVVPKDGNLKIEGLKPKMTGVNLRAKVLEIPEPNTVYNKLGFPVRVSNVLIGDETGTIRMVLWNEQIEKVSEGALIEVKNARVAYFKGERQLRIGKYGEIDLL